MAIDNIKVLLIDDDPNVRLTVKSMLEEMNVTKIVEAADGQTAIDYFDDHSNDIDLIICDWNMPHKTGLEFLNYVRKSHKDLPFLMSSARADEESIISAKLSNVTAYLSKPYSFGDLNEKINAIVNNNTDS